MSYPHPHYRENNLQRIIEDWQKIKADWFLEAPAEWVNNGCLSIQRLAFGSHEEEPHEGLA